MLRAYFLAFAVVLTETTGIRLNRRGNTLRTEQEKQFQKNRFKGDTDIQGEEIQREMHRGWDFVVRRRRRE